MKKNPLKNSRLNYVTTWNRRVCFFRAPEKCLISKWDFYDAPHFEIKYYNVWDFELNILKGVRIWNKVWIQKIMLWIKLLRENDGFWIFSAFSESINLEKKNRTMHPIFKLNIYNVSDFEMKFLKRVKSW